MSKKIVILVLFIFNLSFSQIGIGTTEPSASSALEIKSSNSGLLIPRVSLSSTTDTNTITSPATSLLVYNTNNANDVTSGFYYWEGSWKKLSTGTSSSSSGSGWNLTGNTVASTDYLGTNNYFPLIFKVNNSQFSRYHPNGGLAIGSGAAANDNNSVAIGTSATATSSNQAVAIGPSSNAAGYQSVAIGLNAATSNNNAMALGYSSNASGYLASALGVSSTASNNNALALGNNASASGQQSTALGKEASSSGQNATAIGYQATTSQANAIVLGSSSNSSNKVGIGTNSPDERLHIVGSLKLVDGTQGTDYVLTSDANGKASWKDPNSAKYYGEIYRNANLNLASGAINMGSTGLSSNVTLGSDNIQVTKTGTYRITYSVALKRNSSGTSNVELYLGIYGSEIAGTRTFITVANGETRSVSFTKLVNLNAYQAVSVYSNTSDSNISVLANGANLVLELIK